ncbi:MAG: hypothetical protein CM1200mP39_26100 [Dehalococcoidia bacterium]|nr:MAG: hypothetical protein CM1200mP39_26100 [Dehalococcoidia bacterium]
MNEGEDAILDKELMSWPKGVKDARECKGDKGSGPVHMDFRVVKALNTGITLFTPT